MTKFFKIKEKSYFAVIFEHILSFLPEGNFLLKNPAKYNCRGPPAFKCKRYRVDWPSNQKSFHHYQHTKIIQSICSIYQIKSPKKNPAKYNCRGPPTFKCKRYRVDWLSTQKLFHHYQHTKIIHSICSIHQIKSHDLQVP